MWGFQLSAVSYQLSANPAPVTLKADRQSRKPLFPLRRKIHPSDQVDPAWVAAQAVVAREPQAVQHRRALDIGFLELLECTIVLAESCEDRRQRHGRDISDSRAILEFGENVAGLVALAGDGEKRPEKPEAM